MIGSAAEATAQTRLAVVGYGQWGPKIARNAALVTGCRLAAICDLSSDRLDAARRAHPASFPTRSFRALLDDPGVDAVAIATPADTHFELGLAALRAGKHVLVEKPLAGTSVEARALQEESARRCLVLMVDHTYLYSPAVRVLHGLLAAGAVGSVRSFESWRLNSGPVRTDARVHWDLGTHDLSILRYLLADEPASIAATARGGTRGAPHAVDIRIEYADSRQAEIHVDWIAPCKSRRIAIVGTDATILYDDLDAAAPVRLRRAGAQRHVLPGVDTSEPLCNVVRDFIECVADRRRPLSDGEMGTWVVRMLEAADESLRRGGVPLPLLPNRAYA